MNELRQLVRRWLAGNLEYPAFRREFVQRFQTVLNADPAVETAANVIESDCSDYSEGLIDVNALKRKAALAVQSRSVTVETGIAAAVYDFYLLQDPTTTPSVLGCRKYKLRVTRFQSIKFAG